MAFRHLESTLSGSDSKDTRARPKHQTYTTDSFTKTKNADGELWHSSKLTTVVSSERYKKYNDEYQCNNSSSREYRGPLQRIPASCCHDVVNQINWIHGTFRWAKGFYCGAALDKSAHLRHLLDLNLRGQVGQRTLITGMNWSWGGKRIVIWVWGLDRGSISATCPLKIIMKRGGYFRRWSWHGMTLLSLSPKRRLSGWSQRTKISSLLPPPTNKSRYLVIVDCSKEQVWWSGGEV